MDKGTGAVMCCTFGDETDIKWWKKHHLPLKIILTKDGRINPIEANQGYAYDFFASLGEDVISFFNEKNLHNLRNKLKDLKESSENNAISQEHLDSHEEELARTTPKAIKYLGKIHNLKIDAHDENKSARKRILAILKRKHLLVKSEPIKHHVRCAERSGAPIEILVATYRDW